MLRAPTGSEDMSILESLAEAHPLTPAAVRLKAALLFHGVDYDPCLGRAGEWAFPSHMPITLLPGEPLHNGQNKFYTPQLIRFPDDTQARLRVKRESRFRIVDGDADRVFTLLEDGKPVTSLTFEPKLPWAEALTHDGTPMRASGLVQHGDMLVLNVAPGCEYFVVPKVGMAGKTDNMSCTFCLYGVPDPQRLDALGQKLYEAGLPTQTLERVAEACHHPETHARHLYLVGGSMLSMAAEGERYLQISRHLAEQGLTERYYVACGSGAIERGHMEQMKDAGVRGACFNLEVWDPAQFARICPGKNATVGRDRWLASLEEAVDVFGPGNVMSAFVGGAELEGEGAFRSAEEALESNLAAAEYLIPRGIVPTWSIFWKVTGKARGEESFYTLDLFLRLNEATAALRAKTQRFTNPEFFCRRCAYMELEPDFDFSQFYRASNSATSSLP